MRLLSLNIANYDDHPGWSKRRLQICELLIKLQPDLICLQEVRYNPQQITCRDSHQNSGEELLYLLHEQNQFTQHRIITMPTMYYPPKFSYPSPKENVIWEGKSIITHYNVEEYGNFLLHKPDSSHDMNKRSIFWCMLEIEDSNYFIGNLHWGLDKAARLSNARQTAEFASCFFDIPLILVGDYNTEPDASMQKTLKSAGLQDFWLSKHRSKPGFTFPAALPTSRIDQAWGNEFANDCLTSITIHSIKGMSDHRALLLELDI